jgi:glycosyltransferase involved in cell wall biosynthesis
MFVIGKRSDDYTVRPFVHDLGIIKQFLRRVQTRFFNPIKNYPNKTKTLFSSSYLDYSNISDIINEINPDIVHFHWICDEMIKIEDIAKIKAPIVWSLHDMWAFTGGCHYDEECGRYINGCGQCKVLRSKDEYDLSKTVFKRKQRTFSQTPNMTIVGLSRWLANCAKKSSLLRDKRIVNLPNPINTTQYRPVDKITARAILSLPEDKKLVLYGAMNAAADPRKGFNELEEAITKLDKPDIELVVFGSSRPENVSQSKFETYYFGQLNDDISLQILYSACDVMVVPSLQENLSNAIMESMSCATPAVGFAIGGNNDLIDHKTNGYLAVPFDSNDLAKGIEWVLYADNYDELCTNARNKVLEKFDSKVVAKQYIELYKEVLHG